MRFLLTGFFFTVLATLFAFARSSAIDRSSQLEQQGQFKEAAETLTAALKQKSVSPAERKQLEVRVHERFGMRPLPGYTHFGIGELAYYTLVRRLKTVSPLNYVPYVKAEVMRVIRTELGWQPSIDFEEGLRDTVRWYADHRAWWEPLKDRAPVVEDDAWGT